MAEILGTVASALSVAAFFNNCVDCFEYIQLARHFGRDYRVCQLRLDVARTRLGRWGEAVRINEDARFAVSPEGEKNKDKDVQLARAILEEIVLLLETAAKASKRYELRAEGEQLARFDGKKDLDGVHRKLHERLRGLTRKRLKGGSGGVGLAAKTAWALYDGKQFEKLVEQVLGLVDELEKTFPATDGELRKIAGTEVVELGGGEGGADEEESLEALREAASETDEVLVEAVAQRLDQLGDNGTGNRNYAKEVNVGEMAQVQVGNDYGESVLLATGGALLGSTTNVVDVVVAKGSSRVQVGSRFGVKF